MHIVQLANFYGPRSGGLRTAVDRLAQGYCDAGHRVTTVVPGHESAVSVNGDRTVVQIASPIAPLLGGDYRVILDHRAIRTLFATDQPAVVELADKTTLVRPALALGQRGAAVVLFSHERLDAVAARALRCNIADRPIRAYSRWLHSRMDAVVSASRFASEEFGPGTTVHCPLGVDLQRFAPSATERRAVPRIVAAVRLSPEKDPDLLVEISRALMAAGREHEMIVYGDGPLRRRLTDRSAGLPIRFAGFLQDRDRLAAELAAADVGLAPGPLETFGLAALEMLASGTPVVVPDRGALSELADGHVALAAARTGEAFASAVIRLLDGPRTAQRITARRIAEGFAWDRCVEQMLEVFESVRSTRVGQEDALTRSYL